MTTTTPQLSTTTADELHQLRAMTREVGDRELRPHARERDRRAALPPALLEQLGELGFLGLTIPQQHGGMGLGATAYAAVMEELGAADQSVRALISVSVSLVGQTLLAWGTDQQRDTWLPRLAAGGLGAFALTEPGAGSDPTSIATRAERRGDGWVLRGSKMFISNGSCGVLTLVFAQAHEGDRDLGPTCFLVPQSAPGYEATPIHGKLGLRASDTAEVLLREVHVPADAVLGEPGAGLKVALSALDHGRFSLAAGSVGLAREALEVSLTYAAQREQFDRPIAGFQLVQELLAEMHVDLQAARGLVEHAARCKEAGERSTVEVSTAKLFATEAALRCADRAVQIHGGYGYIDEYPVQRLLRDARVGTLYEGTTQVQKLLLGRHLTGISAFG